jgi:hypothetical protein
MVRLLRSKSKSGLVTDNVFCHRGGPATGYISAILLAADEHAIALRGRGLGCRDESVCASGGHPERVPERARGRHLCGE